VQFVSGDAVEHLVGHEIRLDEQQPRLGHVDEEVGVLLDRAVDRAVDLGLSIIRSRTRT
jgi:hypothetical protein